MIRIDIRMGYVLLALVSLTTPAAAEEQGSDWLGAVGDFVRAGLGPARTIDDIRREEERSREAAIRASEPTQTEAAPAPKLALQPVPEPEPEAAPTQVAPAVVAAPVRAAARPAAKPAPVTTVPNPVAAVVPVPPPPARPKPAVPVAVRVPPPPEPLASRIAATATVDQAIKLGGSSDTYGQPVAKPVRN